MLLTAALLDHPCVVDDETAADVTSFHASLGKRQGDLLSRLTVARREGSSLLLAGGGPAA